MVGFSLPKDLTYLSTSVNISYVKGDWTKVNNFVTGHSRNTLV